MDRSRQRVAALACGLLVAAAPLTGCGGDRSAAPASATGGAEIFREAGCGNCHTFTAAGSSGSTGPDLDDLDLTVAAIEQQVREGGGAMPSYEGRLTPEQIEALAAFVAEPGAGGAQ